MVRFSSSSDRNSSISCIKPTTLSGSQPGKFPHSRASPFGGSLAEAVGGVTEGRAAWSSKPRIIRNCEKQ
jgi:hypothetical protein